MVFDNWEQVLKNLETREIDWVASFIKRPHRQAHLSFSNTYLNVPTVSVRRNGRTGDAQNPALAGLRIAAEEGDVTLEMDNFSHAMLDASLTALHNWQQAGLDVSISLNLPSTYLGQANIADNLSLMAKQRDLAAEKILVEVTECSAVSHLAKVLENLARLRIKGFGIAIDDYGTGYSRRQHHARALRERIRG